MRTKNLCIFLYTWWDGIQMATLNTLVPTINRLQFYSSWIPVSYTSDPVANMMRIYAMCNGAACTINLHARSIGKGGRLLGQLSEGVISHVVLKNAEWGFPNGMEGAQNWSMYAKARFRMCGMMWIVTLFVLCAWKVENSFRKPTSVCVISYIIYKLRKVLNNYTNFKCIVLCWSSTIFQ